MHDSWVGDELKVVRNAHGSFHSPLGQMGGMIHTAFSCFISKGKEPWTFKNTTIDADRTKPAAECEEIKYPKPDGVLSFDLLTNLQRSGKVNFRVTRFYYRHLLGTNHDHDQPAHLRVKPEKSDIPKCKKIQLSSI